MNPTATVLVLSLLGAPPASSNDPLCAKREPCRVTETLDAGKDAQGRPLQVKHLELGWADADTSDKFVGRKFGPGGRKAEGSRAEGQCDAAEWWLVRPSQPAQLLLSVCNNGYGMAGVGEDSVTVADNRFTHEQSGGSRERWSVSRTLQLSPLRLVTVGHRNSDSLADDAGESGDYWDVEQLRGEVVQAAPECEEGQTSLGERTLPFLPQVQVDKAYLEGGWKQAGLGACGVEAGNFLLGTQDNPKDAGLKALLVAPDTLLVEVRDNKWTGPSAKWLNDDHLELWLAPRPPQELTGCGKPEAAQLPSQWGIRIVDGKVFPAFGSPQQTLQVERAELPGKQGYRMKLKLPTPFQAISVVYSDSDSGKKQERMLATSAVKFGRPETLNPVRVVPAAEATCGVKNGELSVVPGAVKKMEPDVAVLRME
ncbi:hypothetical protein ATI61_107434 [Archangium gephyra]|uniref:Uncharacterized protein n=1 Tax=Archangium gephyra TaxID=48 RepID=A0AAC8TJK7_9BACT|nr:hypothetical protein [Archangium gephyra]AKJ07995.1 Hypothetical protein AA314_09621 [Archangium gephyra]REG29738.1 hypothetical protein ATI61_107434 [Archangium gephyra]